MNGKDTWTKKGANALTYSFEYEEKEVDRRNLYALAAWPHSRLAS